MGIGKYEFFCKTCSARVWKDNTDKPGCPEDNCPDKGKLMTRKYYAPGVIIH